MRSLGRTLLAFALLHSVLLSQICLLLQVFLNFQVYAPTSNAEEAEVEWFYEDLQDLLELTPPHTNILFIIGDWNAKLGS